MSERPRRLSAFTVIELLVTLGVVSVLMAMGFGILRAAKLRAASARAKGDLAVLAQALENYRRYYGDYPQTGSAGQATPVVGAAIGSTQAQALLFNALTGVYGPSNFSSRINGPIFVEVSKLQTEVALNATTFAVPVGTPPAKPVVANSFLDPWGNRYLYFYKPATPAGRAGSTAWSAASYVLYSAGPDGQHTAPNTSTGLFSGTTQTTGTNADNLYANP